MVRAVSHRVGALLVPVAVVLGGCDMSLGHLTARATDEWTRTYPLAAGGEVRIANSNGRIEIEGIDGSTVEVRAEKIAHGATDAAARELLPRIVIKEDATANRVSLETERMSGILIGVSYEVRYHVRAPKKAMVSVTNTNGQVLLTALSGEVTAQTTNGAVNGKSLTGAIEAHTTNGAVNIDMASVGSGRIALRTTNGSVTLAIPETAKADISASVTNGGISAGSLEKLEISETSRRKLEGRLNGGGTPIELRTTNGGIRIRARESVADTRTDDDRKDR
jgi:DUF4097 and DUF4098 domain-containing protein YvlB